MGGRRESGQVWEKARRRRRCVTFCQTMPDPAFLHSHIPVWMPRYSSCSGMQLMRIVSGEHPSEDLLHLFYTCELNEQEHPGAESDVAICCTLCKQVVWPVQKWESSIVLFSPTLRHSSERKPKAGPTVRRANGSAQGVIWNRCQRHERTHSPEQNLGKQLSVNKVGASATLICSVLNGSGKGG